MSGPKAENEALPGGAGPRPRDDLAGRTVAGKFVIESFVGSGAMGDVWRARQTALGKIVAIKVLHRELALYEELIARFQREAQAASRLDHPGTIRVIDFGEEPDGMLYIAMEYVDGIDLQRLVARAFPLDEARVVDIVSQALAAVAAAHAQGILHRDLKPENILVQAGRDDDGRAVDVVKVCDFGIAKIVEPRSEGGEGPASPGGSAAAVSRAPAPAPITATGLAVGTPEYMSPEQARGTPVDARSDVYSMGVVLYYMLTRTLPFQAETAVGVAVKHLFDAPQAPSERVPEVSRALEAVCLRAMRKKPEERYDSARQMRADLQAIRAGASVVGSAPVSSRRGERDTLPAIPEAPAPDGGDQEPGPRSDLGRAPTLAAPHVLPAEPPRPAGRRRLPWALSLAVLALGFVVWSRLARLPGGARPGAADGAALAPAGSVASGAADGPSASSPAPLPPGSASVAPPPTTGARTVAAEGPSSVAPAGTGPSSMSPPPIARAPATPPSGTPREPAGVAPPPPEPPVAPPAPPSPPATTAAGLPPPPPVPDPTGVPPPAPPVAPLDVDAAKVGVGGVTTTSGLPASSVRAALAHAGFTRCYRDALRAAGTAQGGTATLRISIDDTGHVTSATAGGMGFLPGARACVESAARALRIPNVDTGEATAEVQLSFTPR